MCTLNICNVQGLCSNSTVRVLLLRGNNMSGASVSLLGRLLRQNNTLTRLSLEWNCVGLDQDCFADLCDGLLYNNGLETLDIRNNQLTQQEQTT